MERLEAADLGPEQAWIATLVGAFVAIALAALAFTQRVYYGFLWRYFWGPVRADAEGESCFVHLPDEGRTVPGRDALGCDAASYDSTVYIAEPGYTVISTISYIVVLVFMLAGVYLLVQRLDLEPYRELFFALVPFMLFGGALRTVEDAFVAAQRAGETPAIEFPASALLISPFIYFTVFGIVLASLLVSKALVRRAAMETYTSPLAAIGTACLAASVGYLVYLSVVTDYVSFRPSILVVILGLAIVSTVLAYGLTDWWSPAINAGTGLVGAVVVWGHAVDGFANVLANDWTHLWDLGLNYDPKHPFNEFVMDMTNAIQGGEEILGVYVGLAWPFALIKIVVPLAIVGLFDEQFMDESPRFAMLLLAAILAVGLGPGTRDMLRFAFGI